MSEGKKSVAERTVERLVEFTEALEARSDDVTLGAYRVTQRVAVEPEALIQQDLGRKVGEP